MCGGPGDGQRRGDNSGTKHLRMEMMNPCLERSALPLDGPPSAPLLPMEVFDSLSLLAATSLQTGLRQPDAEIGTMTVPNIIRPLSSTAMPISSAWRPWVAPPQVRRRPLALVNASPMRSMPFAHSPVSLAPSVCGYPRINSTSLPASPVPKHARRLSVRSAALRPALNIRQLNNFQESSLKKRRNSWYRERALRRALLPPPAP